MHIQRLWIIAGAFLVLSACGCASDRPRYVEPALSSRQAVVLKGSSGTYVTRVDGADVEGSGLRSFNAGSNEVTVSPGEHELRVDVTVGTTQRWCSFVFRCDAGHTYEFSPKSMFDLTLKVTDQTTNQTMLID